MSEPTPFLSISPRSPTSSPSLRFLRLSSTSPNASSPPHSSPGRHGTLSNGGTDKRHARGFGATPIQALPTELLSHIFAHLPPSALGVAQLVCREWNEVISDETSWRTAFETYFGIVDGHNQVALGRRLEPSSWRAEYIGRVALLHRWSKSRTPSLTHNPGIGTLSAIHIALPSSATLASGSSPASTPSRTAPNISPTLLSLSLHLSTAIQSTPFTGKVAKSSLPATPLSNLGMPLHLPLLSTNSAAISPDGSKVVYGMEDGSLRFVTCGNGLSGRGTPGTDRGEVRTLDAHREGVDVVALAFGDVSGKFRPDVFASVGSDGVVAVWVINSSTATRERPPPATRLWTARIETRRVEGGTLGTIVKASYVTLDSGWTGRHGRAASVAVGMSDGSVHAWTGLDLEQDGSTTSATSGNAFVLESVDGVQKAVDRLAFDPSQEQLALFAHRQGGSTFHRYILDDGSSTSTLTTFALDSSSVDIPLTAFTFDFTPPPPLPTNAEPKITGFTAHSQVSTPTTEGLPPSDSIASLASLASTVDERPTLPGAAAFGRRKFVVAGDELGRVLVWDWDAEVPTQEDGVVLPRMIFAGVDSRVTTLEVTQALVFVGTLDGTVRAFDPLTSRTLRTFKDRSAPRLPARMLAAGLLDANDEERWMVSHIRATTDAVVAAIGGRIVAWRLGTEPSKKKGKGVAVGQGRMSARAERFRSDMELRLEVKESLDSLSSESSDRLAQNAREARLANEFGLPPSLDNMTEDEAVALALLLSLDEEEEERWHSRNASPMVAAVSGEDDSFALDLDSLDLDDDVARPERSFGNRDGSFSHEFDFDDPSASRSPTSLGPRSLSHSLSVPSSPSPSRTWRPSSSSSSNTKIQLSPRLGPTYGSSSANAGARMEVPDMSEELWPTASSTTSTPSRHVSPAPTSTTTTPASTAKRGWSDVARVNSPAPSLLTERLMMQESRDEEKRRRDEQQQEDEELRFALELSRAEEESRKLM